MKKIISLIVSFFFSFLFPSYVISFIHGNTDAEFGIVTGEDFMLNGETAEVVFSRLKINS